MGLYLLFILTFSVPAVQEFMGRKAAGMLAQKLGTSVSIGRLDYGIPSHVTLYDVLIKDQQGKELLKATRLSTRIDLMQLAEGQISVATAQLFGAHDSLAQNVPGYDLGGSGNRDHEQHDHADARVDFCENLAEFTIQFYHGRNLSTMFLTVFLWDLPNYLTLAILSMMR